MQTSVQWYIDSIKELQNKLKLVTENQLRHDLHNEGGWDKYLVRLDVCRDIVTGLVKESEDWK